MVAVGETFRLMVGAPGFGDWTSGRPLYEGRLEKEPADGIEALFDSVGILLTSSEDVCDGSGRTDMADSERGGMFSSLAGSEGREGSGRAPVGLAGRFILRSERYEAMFDVSDRSSTEMGYDVALLGPKSKTGTYLFDQARNMSAVEE